MLDMRCKHLKNRPRGAPRFFESPLTSHSGLHGYTHEYVRFLTEEQERKVMAKSIEVYQEFTGKYPKGWVSPGWEVGPKTMSILEDFGIEYDHSMLHHDCQPYYVADVPLDSNVNPDYSKDPDTWMVPMKEHKPTKVVEIPGSYNVDDWRELCQGIVVQEFGQLTICRSAYELHQASRHTRLRQPKGH